MSCWVAELEFQLESAHHESEDWAAKATRAWVAELLVAEGATGTERGLVAKKVHLIETEAVL